MEKRIMIENNDIRLEAAVNEADSGRAVVITHPHPLYGGDMHNPVVAAISAVFSTQGVTTLRFNFRGTGQSSGRFDDGAGEQDDVRSAFGYLAENGFDDIFLAGYSFGSRINASVVETGIQISDHIMVSPPAAFMSFDDIDSLPGTGLVVTGSQDEIAPPGLVKAHLERWAISPQFAVIDHCDHFYSGCLPELSRIIGDYLKNR